MAGAVLISTGDIKRDYEVVDVVHAAQVIRSWWVTTGGRELLKFIPEVNEKLKGAAAEKGCDGVIWVRYDFTRGSAAGGRTTAIVIAYGTGVKYTSSDEK
jgi:hypothetical protein